MSKLVSYLQTLISALLNKVPEYAAPKQNHSSVEVTQTTQNVVSPVNGWVSVFAQGATQEMSTVSVNTTTRIAHIHSVGQNRSASIHAPVKKGETITIVQNGFDSGAWINFIQRGGD